MNPLQTPPKRRNAQVRTYWRLLQFALQQHSIADEKSAREICNKLQQAHTRITASPRDRLEGLDVPAVVRSAHRLLGLTEESLLKPKGASNE